MELVERFNDYLAVELRLSPQTVETYLRDISAFLSYVERLAAEPDGPTLVYVTHHIDEITPAFRRVTVMKDGRVRADGSPTEVVDEKVLSDAYGHRFAVHRDGDRFYARP